MRLFSTEFDVWRHQIRRHFHVPQGSSDLIRASLVMTDKPNAKRDVVPESLVDGCPPDCRLLDLLATAMKTPGRWRVARRNSSERKSPSQPVSRVLSRTIIHLRPASPRACSGLPEPGASDTMGFLFGLAPGGVCLAADCCQPRGALLPHHFTLTGPESGGMLSVALSVGSRPPGITWRPALWSPDFPPPAPEGANSDCPADSDHQPSQVPCCWQHAPVHRLPCPALRTFQLLSQVMPARASNKKFQKFR